VELKKNLQKYRDFTESTSKLFLGNAKSGIENLQMILTLDSRST